MSGRLARTRDFQKVYRAGICLRDRLFNFYFCPNSLGKNRLGVLASKKMGRAVQRNRAKRLIREAFRRLEKKCQTSFDMVISAKSTMIGLKLPEISGALQNVLVKVLEYKEKA